MFRGAPRTRAPAHGMVALIRIMCPAPQRARVLPKEPGALECHVGAGPNKFTS